jgi:acyl carrier protein
MDIHPEFDDKILSLIIEAVPGKFRKVKITKETRLQADLGLDSLGLAALVFRLEEAFGIDLGGLDLGINLSRMRTVDDAINASREIVERARAAKNQ